MKKYILLVINFVFTLAYGQVDLLEKAEQHIFTNQDSAYYFLNKLYKESIEKKDWIRASEALNTINMTSAYHGNFSKFQSFLQKEDALLLKIDSLMKTSSKITNQRIFHWYNKGNFYYTLQSYNQAENYFFKILNTVEQFPDSIIKRHYSEYLLVANNYLATIYRNEFKYELAEEFYTENLRLHKKFKDNEEALFDTKNLIASLKSAQKDYITSNKLAKESINYYLNNTPENNLNSLLSTSLLLTNNYIKLNQPDSAKTYLNIIKTYLKKRKRFTSEFIELSAKISVLEGNYDKALTFYNNALKELENTKNNGDYIAEIYNEIANVHYINGNLSDALLYNEKALQMFSITKISNSELRANSKITILKILKDISKNYNYLGKKDNFSKVIEYGFITIKKLEDLKKSFYNDSDKQVLVENVLPIFESSIEATYQLYSDTKNNAYIDTAFTFFERSKSTILLDALYKNNATKFSGIPDDLLEKEKILKVTIAQLEKKIKKQDKNISNQLFKLKREYENLIKNIEVNHPAYFDLKHNTEFASLLKVQKSLNSDELVLSYFFGDKAVYVISITNTEKSIVKIITNNSDIQNILELQKMINNPQTTISNLAQVSFKIYQKFVAPAVTKSNLKKIVIMPDGILSTIPFEALNIANNKIDYLLNHFNVSYINSATLWFQLQKKYKKQKEPLIAFAPSFNNNSDFSNLPNAAREVAQINQFFNGTVFVENEATLKNFKLYNKNYNIIHLATHAQTDNEIPEYSFLAFAPNEEGDNLIYVNDLYAMNINADMVTLSACKSGLGDLKKGEGLLSLSRAFYYAGAKSLVYTLWDINDSSSSEIMENFYKNLSDGVDKDQALRNAKLTFLEKHKEDNFKHPYYWSSFIISGNTAPLTTDSYLFWYVIGSIFLIVIVLFRKKLYQLIFN